LGEAFSLGLSTGPYCLTSCAPLLVPFLMAEGRGGWGGGARLLGEFIAGRLAAYLLFGLAAGALGAAAGGRLPPKALHAAVLCSGLFMLAVLALKTAPHLRLCAWAMRTKSVRRLPFVLGFLVGINICPPFVAGLLRVLGLGGALQGAAYFAAFFAGTTLYLVPLFAVVPFAFIRRLQNIGALACGLTGLWFTGMGLYGLMQ
jgi:sulfite exporter TauE/SafE